MDSFCTQVDLASVASDFLVNVQKMFQVQIQLLKLCGKNDNFSFPLNKIKYEEN